MVLLLVLLALLMTLLLSLRLADASPPPPTFSLRAESTGPANGFEGRAGDADPDGGSATVRGSYSRSADSSLLGPERAPETRQYEFVEVDPGANHSVRISPEKAAERVAYKYKDPAWDGSDGFPARPRPAYVPPLKSEYRRIPAGNSVSPLCC